MYALQLLIHFVNPLPWSFGSGSGSTVTGVFISKRHDDISVDMWIRMEQMTAALA